MDRDNKIAVLVDAENVSEKYAQDLLDEVTNYGIPTYKRIYGDWTNPQLSSWKNSLLTYSFTPIQQYSYTSGKNSSDSAMIIDAMDILYSGKVTGFCLVTSDSDFTRLAMRLREAGMLVIGMGEKKTPQPFIKACEKFIYLEVLKNAEEKAEAAIRDGSAQLVILSSDASGNTRKKFHDKCTFYHVAIIDSPYTKREIGEAMGQSERSVVAITSEGLARKLTETINQTMGEI